MQSLIDFSPPHFLTIAVVYFCEVWSMTEFAESSTKKRK